MGKFYDAIMGLVVGDALGVPYEFKKRDTFTAVDMVGFGTHNQPVGTWSDDSSMTLATAESLVRRGEIDLKDIMTNFGRWFYRGQFTPGGVVFDVGGVTRIAIVNFFEKGYDVNNCGGRNEIDNGNGSLMRILPLAFVKASTVDIYSVSSLTHAHPISVSACGVYTSIAEYLIAGHGKNSAVNGAFFGAHKFLELPRNEIKSTGYVVDTLEAALWCFYNTTSYRECVLTAVNLGGDTDTIAAVAGGLAGIYYGVGGDKGIPEEWIEKIRSREWIKNLCEAFEARF